MLIPPDTCSCPILDVRMFVCWDQSYRTLIAMLTRLWISNNHPVLIIVSHLSNALNQQYVIYTRLSYTDYIFIYILNKSYNALLQESVHQDKDRYSGNKTWNTVTAGAEGDTIDHAQFRPWRENIYLSNVSF